MATRLEDFIVRIVLLVGFSISFMGHALAGQPDVKRSGKGSANPPAVKQGSGPQTSSALQGLSEQWGKLMRELNVPGMAVAVVQGDQVTLLEGFGIRDPQTNAPVTPNTVFFLADSTKSIVAMAVAKLADDGRIDLDAPVQKYLPSFELANLDVSATITVRDLLAQRWEIDSFSIKFGESFTGEMDDERFYRLLREVRPRMRFTRGPVPYTTLGRMIKAVSGMSWQDYVKKHILAPAGMNNTFCRASEMYAQPEVAMPIEEVNGFWRVLGSRKTDRTMHAGAGIASSVSDMARWLRLNMNDGQIDGRRILSEKRIHEMHTSQVGVRRRIFEFDGRGYGLGWYIADYQGKMLVHHVGLFPGYRVHCSFMPEEKIGVVALVNTSSMVLHFGDMVACDVYNRLLNLTPTDMLTRMRDMADHERDRLAYHLPEGANPAKGGLSLAPQAYVGKYVSEVWGTLNVAYEDGLLTMRIGDLSVPIVSTGPDWFAPTIIGKPLSGRFEITGGTTVSAVVIERGPISMNFKR